MKLLLDTHILIWALADDSRLGGAQRAALGEAAAIYVSAASVWEVGLKRALGKLAVPDHLFEIARVTGCRALPISWAHAARAAALPRHHGDPFDRMLIAQAQADGLTLVSTDQAFAASEVDLL